MWLASWAHPVCRRPGPEEVPADPARRGLAGGADAPGRQQRLVREKNLSLRILGAKTLDLDLSATGAITGTLVREAEFQGTCQWLEPSLTGSFSGDGTVFATKKIVAPGECRGLVTSPVSETFSGTVSVKAKAPGSTLEVKMRADSALSYRGGKGEPIRMTADGNLSATKLQVTIANPGNF